MIMSAYKEEFKHRLRQREIIPELKNYERRRKLLCDLYVEDAKKSKDKPYSHEELTIAKRKLKKKKSSGRDGIPAEIYLTDSDRLDKLTLHILNSIKSSQVIPSQWADILIVTIFKNKGSKKCLINYRGIFLKQVLSKIFERLNMNRISENIQKIDKAQAGSQTNRSTADQTFLLRSGIDHSIFVNKPMYITLYDFAQCFDSLWLDDCIISLKKLGISNEVLSIIKNLNTDCNIKVKTPVGVTSEFEIDNIVQQGSVTGGVLCSASTGEVNATITSGGIQIGTSTIRCLIFVDDIATMNHTVEDTYNSHEKVVWFSEIKRLTLSGKKCMILCVNGRAADATPRLKIQGTEVETKEVVVYLGDIFNRILLYPCLFLQVVLYNAQAWSNLNNMDKKNLQTIQMKFLKRAFHALSSTPNCLTLLETGITPILHAIHIIKQLMFLYHILMLEEGDPVRTTYEQQLKYPAANWANEVTNLRSKYEIKQTDKEIKELTQQTWKGIVDTQVRRHAFNQLTKEAEDLKHAHLVLPYTRYERQQYLVELSPARARKIFHIRTNTIDLKSVRKYKYGISPTCRLCGLQGEETVSHVVNTCPKVSRTGVVPNVYTTNCEQLQEVARRCIEFSQKLDEQENV